MELYGILKEQLVMIVRGVMTSVKNWVIIISRIILRQQTEAVVVSGGGSVISTQYDWPPNAKTRRVV